MEPLAALRAHPLLSSLPDSEISRLRRRSVTKRWKKDEIVIRRGDPCDGVHGVISGSIVTVIEAANGKAQALGTFGPGRFVGTLAALDGGGHHLTVMTREASSTLFLARRDFNAALATLNDSQERVIGLLCNELRSNLHYLESVLFLDVSSRLARLILHLQRHLAITGEERPSIRFSQKEIANLLGCSREWVGRELGKWRDAGIIDIRRRHLVVRNRSALDRLGA